MLERYLEKRIREDLKDKMIFVGGPRQVGKTTMAEHLAEKHFSGQYSLYNWDHRQDRRRILDCEFDSDSRLIIFDELHKYSEWKNYLKGEYDKNKSRRKYLVTGSSHLDIFRKGGDSLQGRYYHYRLHPLSLAELAGIKNTFEPFGELSFQQAKESREIFQRLMLFGGFPEVYLKENQRTLRRWHNDRVDRLIRDDIRDLENVRDLSALQVLVELLPAKVGSLFSLNSLREDLKTTHKTMSRWVDILEHFYYHYRIYPFNKSGIKSLRKEPKLYLWDWSELDDPGAVLENLVASHLLKFCHYLHDAEGYKARLHFLRDISKREVDFLVAVDRKPWFCVETSVSSDRSPGSIDYFASRLNIPFRYVVTGEHGIDREKDGTRIISADKFLSALV